MGTLEVKCCCAVVSLLIMITWVSAQSDSDSKKCEAAATCKDCLNAAGFCKWCADPDFNQAKENRYLPRCNLKSKLVEKGCNDIQISDGEVKKTDPGQFSSTTHVAADIHSIRQ